MSPLTTGVTRAVAALGKRKQRRGYGVTLSFDGPASATGFSSSIVLPPGANEVLITCHGECKTALGGRSSALFTNLAGQTLVASINGGGPGASSSGFRYSRPSAQSRGGHYAGVFLGSVSQANSLVIAGGAGAGGFADVSTGGSGGGYSGGSVAPLPPSGSGPNQVRYGGGGGVLDSGSTSYSFSTQRENDYRSGTFISGITGYTSLSITVSYSWSGNLSGTLNQSLSIRDPQNTVIASGSGSGSSGSFTVSSSSLNPGTIYYLFSEASTSYGAFAERTGSGSIAWQGNAGGLSGSGGAGGSGYESSGTPGSALQGGSGYGSDAGRSSSGSGGGGYFGGGGGGSGYDSENYASSAGGGGGSGFVSPSAAYNIENIVGGSQHPAGRIIITY